MSALLKWITKKMMNFALLTFFNTATVFRLLKSNFACQTGKGPNIMWVPGGLVSIDLVIILRIKKFSCNLQNPWVCWGAHHVGLWLTGWWRGGRLLRKWRWKSKQQKSKKLTVGTPEKRVEDQMAQWDLLFLMLLMIHADFMNTKGHYINVQCITMIRWSSSTWQTKVEMIAIPKVFIPRGFAVTRPQSTKWNGVLVACESWKARMWTLWDPHIQQCHT